MKKPISIVVANRKGGVGKTTLVVNLAAELASRGKNTLVIDMDTQANTTFGLGTNPTEKIPTVHSIFFEKFFSIEKAILRTKWNNLYLIPANPMFEHSAIASNTILSTKLQSSSIYNNFDFILIDTPPSLDSLLLNAVVASDYLLIPFTPNFLSTMGIKSLARALFKIAIQENPSLRLLGFVPVMMYKKLKYHKKLTSEIADQYGQSKLLPIIRPDLKLVEAFEAQTPVKFYAPSAKSTKDFEALSDEILKRIDNLV